MMSQFLPKKILMSGLSCMVLSFTLIHEADATTCYCAGQAVTQHDIIHAEGSDYGPKSTCEECRRACHKNAEIGFSWGKCWGQVLKKSNCKGC